MRLHIPSRIKPSSWQVDRNLADPRHLGLWRDCALFWPLWDIHQKRVCDVSGRELHGTLGADINPVADWHGSPYGASLRFTGQANDKVSVTAPAGLLDNLTKLSGEVLFKIDTVGTGRHGILNKYRPDGTERSWRLFVEAGEYVFQASDNGTGDDRFTTTGAGLQDQTWYHAFFTYEDIPAGNSPVHIWSNGKKFSGDVSENLLYGNTQPFLIGQRTASGGGGTSILTGNIALVRLWPGRVLNDGDIQRLTLEPWGMVTQSLVTPYVAEHAGSQAAGPWIFGGEAADGVQGLRLDGLTNDIEYDVQVFTEDTSMNLSSGSSIVQGTPSEAATGATDPRPTPLRFPRAAPINSDRVTPKAGRFL